MHFTKQDPLETILPNIQQVTLDIEQQLLDMPANLTSEEFKKLYESMNSWRKTLEMITDSYGN